MEVSCNRIDLISVVLHQMTTWKCGTTQLKAATINHLHTPEATFMFSYTGVLIYLVYLQYMPLSLSHFWDFPFIWFRLMDLTLQARITNYQIFEVFWTGHMRIYISLLLAWTHYVTPFSSYLSLCCEFLSSGWLILYWFYIVFYSFFLVDARGIAKRLWFGKLIQRLHTPRIPQRLEATVTLPLGKSLAFVFFLSVISLFMTNFERLTKHGNKMLNKTWKKFLLSQQKNNKLIHWWTMGVYVSLINSS